MALAMVTPQLDIPRFPRAKKYSPEWVLSAVSGGANSLWLTEWLCEALDLKPGQRVLDLGCGRGASSVFLRREFGVQVVAADLWFDPTERAARLRDAGVDDGVLPVHADARSLPFAEGWFDAIVSIDSFVYYGTDDLYLANVARSLEPGGTLAIAGAGMMQKWRATCRSTSPRGGSRRSGACTRPRGGGAIGSAPVWSTCGSPTTSTTAGSTGSPESTPRRRTTRPRSPRSKPIRAATSATCAPWPRAARARPPRRRSRACR
jgi:protein-L-isoaspartate O-methyltransferase